MEKLISLVNKLQRACTALGGDGEESACTTLWDLLPAIAVVGGQDLTRERLLTLQLPNCYQHFQYLLAVSYITRGRDVNPKIRDYTFMDVGFLFFFVT